MSSLASMVEARGGRRALPRSTRGFTLLEIILVLVIVAVTLTLIPPLFGGAIGTVSLQREARQIANALRYVRSAAIAEREPQTLTIDVAARRYVLSTRDEVVELASSTHVELITAQSEMLEEQVGSIRFFPDGGATGGQIILSRRARRLVIDINWVTGGVKVFEETGAG